MAKIIVVFTGLVALGTVVTAILSVGAARDATDYLDGQLSESQFRDAIGPVNAIQLLTGLATLTTAVLTIIWMFRIAHNVRAYGRDTTWSPLFAIFGWILPPMVLYIIPFLVLRELWKASDPVAPGGSDSWKRSGENRVLWGWFALFGLLPAVILAVQVGSIAGGGIPAGDLESVADSLQDFETIGLATAAINVLAAVVWIAFVRQLTTRHTKLTSEI